MTHASLPSRRDALRSTVAGLLASWATGDRPSRAADDSLIVRGGQPLNAETPVSALDSWVTPVDRFFVRSHFGPPGETPRRVVAIGGKVKSSSSVTLPQLEKMDRATVVAVLQCSGNGRAFYEPVIPGVRWERGAVGNAEWQGVRLKDLLEKAGIEPGAKHVQFEGNDRPPNVKTPAFHRSLPIEKAMDPSTLVAFLMNGQPIPRLNGGPFRLIVPGWTGNHSMKWLRSITASDEESPGFFQRIGYKLPKVPAPPGAVVKPEDMESVTWLNVKSLIASPSADANLAAGPTEIRGVAWTGKGKVVKVEVSVDDQPWREAIFHGPDQPFAWRMWKLPWTASPGPHIARARATDSMGETQPAESPWNKSGYLWNGVDSVSFRVMS